MVARHSLRFVISCADDLRRAEDAIGSSAEPVIIEANLESTALLEIEEFRALAAAVRVAGANVTFTSDDPLRRELARIAGLKVIAPEPAVSGIRRALEANAPTRKIDSQTVVTAKPPRDPEPVPTLTEVLNDYTNHGDEESYASFSFVINPPVPRRQDQPTGEWHYQAHPYVAAGYPRRRGSRRSAKVAAIATVFALLLLTASAAVLVALLAPQATVTLVPATSTLNAEVRYGIAGTGAAYDVAIEPETITSTMTYTATIPTTGSRTEPDGTATGEILLTNPMTHEVVVPAGTVFTSPSGIDFTTTDEVVVPAADPFGTLTMGSAVVAISATTPGPDGNIEAQALSGQLPDGIFYTNREATAGGTVREIATVAEADLEALRSQALAAFIEQAPGEVASSIPAGHNLVVGSAEAGTMSATFDYEAGADASEVTIRASQDVSALVYDPAELEQMAKSELNQRLTREVPKDNVLLAESIQVADPVEIKTNSGNPEYRMTASARTRAVLDEDVLAALKHDLVGASPDEAGLKVAMVKGVARFDIEYGPEWFPFEWAPRFESRIAIDIDDGTPTETTASETRP